MIIGIIAGFLSLVFLVVAHEFGHAIAARRNGVIVQEFGVGMPPKAWSKKLKNGILFSINWLPLGGFVKLQGEYDAADKPGDYGAASFKQKTKILLSGVMVNWLIATIIITVLAITGLPKVLPNQFTVSQDTQNIYQPVQISDVIQNNPASKAGIKAGDKIAKFNGNNIVTADDLIKMINQKKGTTSTITYERNGIEKTVDIKVLSDSTGGYIGVGLAQREYTRSTWSAPIVGVVATAQFSYETFKGIGNLFGNLINNTIKQFSSNESVRKQSSIELKKIGDNVAGPIGIVGTIFPAAEQAGITQLALLVAIISISLATMNVLPIPALDGGRWFTMLFFKMSKKQLTMEREEKIQTVGFMIIMGLAILVTALDVKKLF